MRHLSEKSKSNKNNRPCTDFSRKCQVDAIIMFFRRILSYKERLLDDQ